MPGSPPAEPASPSPTEYSADQVYWDGKVDGDVPQASCASYLSEHYARPELMAIGDSLFNGVQSLRINWWLSEWSAPTLVAIRLGLLDEYAADRKGGRSFHGPQYPSYQATAADTQDFGFNLEHLPPRLGFLAMPRQQAAGFSNLLGSWRPPNHRAMVDNIAFSGATTTDLLEGTPSSYGTAAKAALPKLARANALNGFPPLADVFFNVNAAFVLNPMHASCLDGLTPMQQVALRRPRRLLVNIGANDGLWQVALTAKPVSDSKLSKSIGPVFKAHMQEIIDRLAGIDGIEHIYIDGLALPSQTANLVPAPDGRSWNPDLLTDAGGLSDAQVAEADRVVADGNSAVSLMVDTANAAAPLGHPLFAFVDVAATLARYDYKRCVLAQPGTDCNGERYKVDARRFGLPFTQYFDNNPLRFDGPGGPQTAADLQQHLKQGGLMSFDNMHLSTVGYGILAQAIDQRIGQAEHGLPKVDDARCKGSTKEPGYAEMRHGDCVELLTTPGYAFSDRTQRNFVFDRLGGAKQTQNRLFFSSLAGFVYKWIK